MSSLSSERLGAWRLFFESALVLIDLLDDDFRRHSGFSPRWYDVLVHLEETPDGLRMSELAEMISYSKSGLTRVIDGMEDAGLIRRYRPENDRRSVFVFQTDNGREAMTEARRRHHKWIEQHFSAPLTDADINALTRAFEKLSDHVRPLRPGRIGG
jgi:DNA-binding MarR family transcriptional regulator